MTTHYWKEMAFVCFLAHSFFSVVCILNSLVSFAVSCSFKLWLFWNGYCSLSFHMGIIHLDELKMCYLCFRSFDDFGGDFFLNCWCDFIHTKNCIKLWSCQINQIKNIFLSMATCRQFIHSPINTEGTENRFDNQQYLLVNFENWHSTKGFLLLFCPP